VVALPPGGGRGGAGGAGGGGGGGEGEGDLGEEAGQAGHVPDHHPGLLGLGLAGGGPGAPLLEEGEPAVLVDRELVDQLLLPGEPQLVAEVGPGLRQLEVDEDARVLKVLPGVAPLAAHHAGRQGRPAAVRRHVADAEDVGEVVLREDVAGRHVLDRDDGAGLLPDQPHVHLGEGLHPAPHPGRLVPPLLARPGGAGDLQVSLHRSLPSLVTLGSQLFVFLLELLVLGLELVQLPLHGLDLGRDVLGLGLHLLVDSELHHLGDLLTRSQDLRLYLGQLLVLLVEQLPDELEGDPVVPHQLLDVLDDLDHHGDGVVGHLAEVDLDVPALAARLLARVLQQLVEVHLDQGHLLLDGLHDGGGGGGVDGELPVEGLVHLLVLLQLLPQVLGVLLVAQGLVHHTLDLIQETHCETHCVTVYFLGALGALTVLYFTGLFLNNVVRLCFG